MISFTRFNQRLEQDFQHSDHLQHVDYSPSSADQASSCEGHVASSELPLLLPCQTGETQPEMSNE